jgi:ABC-type uncharacterized transport system fused permease/ATPase subunit
MFPAEALSADRYPADVLSYPQADTYRRKRYATGAGNLPLPHLVARLDEANHWQRMLSPGEQQRLAFARALLLCAAMAVHGRSDVGDG